MQNSIATQPKLERTLSLSGEILTLSIPKGKRVEVFKYRVKSLAVPEGRAFRLIRTETPHFVDQQDDPGVYDLHATEGGCSCDCRGHVRWGRCKHADAIRKLLAEGKL